MPIDDGLYLIKQTTPGKSGVEHYGILNVGNRFNQVGVTQPVVYHNTPPNLMTQWLRDTGVRWRIVRRILDEVAAKKRIAESWQKPFYDTLGNNCEHFAFYAATGERKSPQVRSVVGFVGIIGALLLMGSNGKA